MDTDKKEKTEEYKCPECGALWKDGSGLFCENCGTQLISVNGNPGRLVHGQRISGRRQRKTVYAKKRVTGVSSTWTATKAEQVMIWLSTLMCFAMFGAGFLMLDKNVLVSVLLFIGAFVVVFGAFAIAALNPKHREEIKENMVVYRGNVDYKRNPISGEKKDNSELHIEKKYPDNK